LRINFFKQRSNRRYNYTPRYYKGKELDNPYEMGSRFDRYRETTNAGDISSKWLEERKNSRTRNNRGLSKRMLIILLILILIVLYILDFDLSIFFRR